MPLRFFDYANLSWSHLAFPVEYISKFNALCDMYAADGNDVVSEVACVILWNGQNMQLAVDCGATGVMLNNS